MAKLAVILLVLSASLGGYWFLGDQADTERAALPTVTEQNPEDSSPNPLAGSLNQPIVDALPAKQTEAIPASRRLPTARDFIHPKALKISEGQSDEPLNNQQPTTSVTGNSEDDIALSFLKGAYNQALRSDPEAARAIAAELRRIESYQQSIRQPSSQQNPSPNTANPGPTIGLNNDDPENTLVSDQPSTSDQQDIADATEDQQTESDDTVDDPTEDPTPPDESYCESRPAKVPGQFRCSCPGDVDYRPNWRDFYNPAFVAKHC